MLKELEVVRKEEFLCQGRAYSRNLCSGRSYFGFNGEFKRCLDSAPINPFLWQRTEALGSPTQYMPSY